ncbi:hypothetical protein BQ8482_111525 [Mesorhizobium delmotii]|uniref:Uncharacterized protein n=1 Tax=Mesorhizobium delmotii TaxID=1631247 RepID=A0A2P9AEP6_9HYPH|nr:hypothetical protein BQ8482_111525 [Mesorhizobium delmotii]
MPRPIATPPHATQSRFLLNSLYASGPKRGRTSSFSKAYTLAIRGLTSHALLHESHECWRASHYPPGGPGRQADATIRKARRMERADLNAFLAEPSLTRCGQARDVAIRTKQDASNRVSAYALTPPFRRSG